jgi:hypothetical protein
MLPSSRFCVINDLIESMPWRGEMRYVQLKALNLLATCHEIWAA